ncbi:MAG: glycosyl transferase [Patescibacteria group bacterium]|uniref:glycosyltransferase family 2 protein n=1 Tax=Caldilinea sp. TaxID=2293560 RepID=UPI0021DF1AE9|nr:glycosyltransferase family 2 protein [Caldilinea sp.]GIV70497.1 MAG: glycosyl transferase [Caldilinea sp.]GIW61004.1 MAG: glycosyl transferase [Patescibacteria group bacterium]
MPNELQPFVSVILPVRNEGSFIREVLLSLVEQDYPCERLEIWVADGLSTDDTVDQVLQIAGERSCPPIYLIENPKRSMPAGFNLALQKAKGDVIIVAGGHAKFAPNYVSRCIELLEKTGADCVGGPIETIGKTAVARAIALAQSSWFGVGGAAFRMKTVKPGFVDTVAFGAYRRSVFDKIGVLDEELIRNQDDEFNFRLVQSGGKIWLDPSIHSVYYSRSSVKSLWKQYFNYGMYKVRVIQKRNAIPARRHLAPGIFVLICLGGIAMYLLSHRKIWLMPVATYTLANSFATLYVGRHQKRLLPYLPIIFATLHFAYGLGFLYGLWKWRSLFDIKLPKKV